MTTTSSPTAPPTRRRSLVRTLAAATMLLGAAAGPFAPAADAGLGSGNPSLTASVTTVRSDGPTDVTVRGTDFLVPPHDCPNVDVFGGVYVMFGWVESGGPWGPSTRSSTSSNGVFGVTYAYPGEGGDANIRDDGTGRVRLVSFTGGGESGAATPFHMDCNGDWAATMTIHSPTFSYVLSSGEQRTIDCRNLASGRCGIFTIGAHGKASATNELFVPITFAATGPSEPGSFGSSGGSTGSGAGVPTDGGTVDGTAAGAGADEAGATGTDEVVVEEVADEAAAFGGTDGAGTGFPTAASGRPTAAAGVPGANDGPPLAVAVAGTSTLGAEPGAVVNTGRRPGWLVPLLVAAGAAAVGGSIWRRRRSARPTEVVA